MDQHLVDHDLEEQGRDQAQHLEEEGGDQHLAQDPAILMDRVHEPGEAERPPQVRKADAAREQQELAGPGLGEGRELDELGPPGRRILDEELAVERLAQHGEAAIPEGCQRRQRCLRQSLRLRAHHTRLEAERPAGPHHAGEIERLAGCAEAVLQLVGGGGDAVEAKQQDEAEKAGIRGF